VGTPFKIVVSSCIVALATGFVALGSFATFNAGAANRGNAFGYGTLVLSDTPRTGVACLSTAGGATDLNANPSCDRLLDLPVAKPGDSAVARLTLTNAGSIDASRLVLFAPRCAGTSAPAESYSGTADPCAALRFYVQRWTDASFSTPDACLYGGSSGAACTFGDGSETLSAFTADHPSSASGLAIAGGLSARASAYITVGVELPPSAGNEYQGRAAALDLDWFLAQ
jgi:hypothetical protein